MAITVTTNHNWRQFKYGYEVPESVHADYDWLDDDARADGWMHYRGHWYHISDVMCGGIEGWQGSIGESFFSSILVNLSDDGEEYQIGLALS